MNLDCLSLCQQVGKWRWASNNGTQLTSRDPTGNNESTLCLMGEHSEFLMNEIMAGKAAFHTGGNYQLVQIMVGT